MNLRMYIRHALSLIVLVVCASYIVLFVLTCLVGIPLVSGTASERIGNTPENIAYVRETTDPNNFTFCVMGDTKGGTATFEELLNLTRSDHPAFAVILGDFVCHPERASHELFVREVTEDGLSFPLFLIPGNHDISSDGFSVKDFGDFYGSSQFHFSLGKHLFIFLDNLPSDDGSTPYLSYLEKILDNQAALNQEIYVFMHVPPGGLSSWILSRGLDGSERFMELARQYGIRYVFAGDHHGYVMTVKDGTTYIVTGGGGARLRGQHGGFHHIVRMAINDADATETVISVRKQTETLELLERNLAVYLWPVLTRSAGQTFSGIILLLLCAVVLVHALRRRRMGNLKHMNGAPTGTS